MIRFLSRHRLQVALSAFVVLPCAAMASGCASAPPAPVVPVISYEQKLARILRLEDQRVLRDPVATPPLAAPARSGRVATVPVPP
ncbi:MAG TPA: hypothetical protein VF332_04670, partial [Vicinamibacterales bacterium]